MDELRLCLLNDSFPPQIDGVANAVVNYARILTQRQVPTEVAVPAYPGVKDDYPFPVVRYKSLNTTSLVGYRTGNPLDTPSHKEMLALRPTLLHSHCPIISTYLARVLREECGAPLILTYHTKFDIDIARAVKSKALQEQSIRLLVNNISACDEVWVVSHGAGENLRSLGYQGDYLVMENGVDFPLGRVPEEQVQALRRQYGLDETMPVFLFVGRMMWYKGLRLTLTGLHAAKEAGCDFRMFFIGDGADRPEMELYAKDLGLADRCIFTGAVRDRELLRTYFCMGDLFLFPSTFDTNGIVVREAAACGLGSLMILDSCAAEGVTNGQNGILIHEDPREMGEAVIHACRDRAFVRRIGENAQVQLYCSWEDSVQRAQERYGEVLKRKAAGAYENRRRTPLEEMIAGAARFTEDMEKAMRSLFVKEHQAEYRHIEAETRRQAKAEAFENDARATLKRLEHNIDTARAQLSEKLERYL